MADVTTTVTSAVETVADAGLSALESLVAARFPGMAVLLIPAEAAGKDLIAEYVPRIIQAAEHEIETLLGELGSKLKALFHIS